MLTWTIGFVCGVVVGQLALLGVLALVRKPDGYWRHEPPSWLCLPCLAQWRNAQRIEEE